MRGKERSIAGVLWICAVLWSAPAIMADDMVPEEPVDPVEEVAVTIRAANPDLHIDHVLPVDEIPGLFEIRVGSNLYYADASGHYLIAGHIFDTETKRDLTQARLEELSRVDWNALPLELSIVSGDPEGTPIAIFTDPDCPYCSRLESELADVSGLKIHTFLYPLEAIHPNARAKAEAIWCAEDQIAALRAVLIERQMLEAGACENPVGDIVALGKQLGINGTPAIIARDGRMHAGVMSAGDLMRWAGAQ